MIARDVNDGRLAMERLTYSAREVAEITGLSLPTIRRHIRDGHLPVTRIGRRVLVSHRDLLAFVSNPKAEREEQA
jgi:excisionase family DNA binding protein